MSEPKRIRQGVNLKVSSWVPLCFIIHKKYHEDLQIHFICVALANQLKVDLNVTDFSTS